MGNISRGAHVTFREGTRQYAANKGIVYVVDEEPKLVPDTSPEKAGSGDMRMVASLTRLEDVERPYSRQRGRMAWVDALQEVTR